MPVSNVSAVTMPDGAIYGYICGEGCLWRYHANGKEDGGKGVRTKLTTDHATPDSSRPVQVAVNRAEGMDQVRHVFYRQPRTDNIWYAEDGHPDGLDGKLSVRQLTLGENPIQVRRTFGLVALADGLLLVGAAPNEQAALRIVAIPWTALAQQTWMKGVRVSTVPLPLSTDSGAGSLDEDGCEVCCDVILPAGDGDPTLVLIAKRKDRDTWRLGCWLAPIGDALTVGPLTEHLQHWTGKEISFPKIQVLPDNTALAYYIDEHGKAQWYTNTNAGLLGYTDPDNPANDVVPQYWLQGWDLADSLAVINQLSKGKNKRIHYGGNASQLVIRSEPVEESPGKLNPARTDAAIPMYAGLLFYNWNGQINEIWSTQLWRKLTRTARPVVPGKQLLVGIIEGPPPIPNENLNMKDRWDPLRYFNGPGYSQSVFAGSRTEEDGFDISWSVGTVVTGSVKGTLGFNAFALSAKAWAKAEFSLQAAYKGAYSRTTTQQSVATITAGSEIEGDGSDSNRYAVQPAGVLVFQTADWTAYQYSYLDHQGNVADGSLTSTEIDPTNVSLEAVPYLMNPSIDPVPGRLSSYVLTQDEHKALEHDSKIDLGDGTGYLTGAWGYDTKTVATFATTDTRSIKHGFKAGLDLLLSAGAEAELFGNKAEATIGGGLKTELEMSWTSKDANGISVGSEVWLRGNSEAPGAFTSYSYRVYLLKESSQWASDLRKGLITEDWPANHDERVQQQHLLEMIDARSEPWKLCYSVSDASFNPATPTTEPVTVRDHSSVTSG